MDLRSYLSMNITTLHLTGILRQVRTIPKLCAALGTLIGHPRLAQGDPELHDLGFRSALMTTCDDTGSKV
jgi:hypothetical protein